MKSEPGDLEEFVLVEQLEYELVWENDHILKMTSNLLISFPSWSTFLVGNVGIDFGDADRRGTFC